MKVTRFPGESISRKDVVLSIPYPFLMELYPVSKAMEAKRDGEIHRTMGTTTYRDTEILCASCRQRIPRGHTPNLDPTNTTVVAASRMRWSNPYGDIGQVTTA